MSHLKPNAQEDKDVEPVSDSPGRTQEPLQSHTFSLKNNAAGLSSDEHENPLNGTQPNPFVYRSVPAVPHAGNSLPSGALVNGPGSHPTSEVHCVLNKGTVLSNNVLDAAWQPEKDTSPEVLPPPSELQSDAWKNTAGPVVKTLATQPGVNTPLSHSEENESKLAYSTLSGDSAEQMHISQPLTKQTIKTRSLRDAEWSESSSDDYDDSEVFRWDSARERFLHNDRRLETKVMHQRHRKHNTHVISTSSSQEKVNNSLNHTYRHFCRGNNVLNVANKHKSMGTQSDNKYSVMPFKDLSRSTALDSEHHVYSTAQEGCNEENDPEDEDNFSLKVEQLKTEQLEQDPLFFSCTICNVNFKEKRHFHRHMMYHLGKHNQVNSDNVSQPFICRECGRLFCDRNSLMRHIIIHQDRLEKLMEEIKVLKNTELEDGATAVQCPQCVFGCNCPKIFVQHAKTHDNLKHYYFCEECNYITLTQQALEAHLHVAHLNTHQTQYRKMTHTNDAEEADHVHVQCKMGFFTCRDKVALERHSELERQRSHSGNYKKYAEQPKNARSKPQSTFGETAHFPHWPSKKGEIYIKKSNTLISDKNIKSPQFKCCTENTLSPSLWRIDKHGKLLLQPVEKLDVATDLTCVKQDDKKNDHKAFGSSKHVNCPATVDFLLSTSNPKLDRMFCQGNRNDLASGSSQEPVNQNSPSVRKMAAPLHNSIDNMNSNIMPRLSQRLQKQSADRELEKGCEGNDNFSDDTSEATGSFLESSENERNPYARRYFRKRQRFSAKDQSSHVLQNEDDGDEDCSDIEQLIIKEEYIETTVCDDSLESPFTSTSDSFDVLPTPGVEHKLCPYCPAMFESGVGLSNHVRGHLHRVGLSYNARHMVSPEQVALRDRQPRIRRRIPTGMRKVRKAVKPETQGEHTCPLCWGWFDTKTGLSNHVRGHLKRIGRSGTSSSKSPLCILNELLQDKKEHHNILQVLNKSQFPSQPFVSQKFISSNGLFLMRTGLPVKIQYEMRSPHPILDSFVPKQETEAFSEQKKLQLEAQRGTKASSSILVELLKARQESMELTARNKQETYATKFHDITKDCMEETEVTSVEPNWAHGECDSNKSCLQCNSSLPTAVSLSGRLQAYACRKRIAILEEPGYDYKQKKPRLRPGLKKKILPSLNAEMYTLTCRFCDLVFQGPLSIQEDWIKHLQRHLLNTSVPYSGTGMVEVLGLHHKIQISMSHQHSDPE
ncbi:zinc finger protein 644 [Thunnus maccoyii]|uniref:zinc finger protein 644 n=1 Tax=Thunnus maccoyii TaxID=8240 RepID=UPI001C4BFC08|nr:zinc finger protein 644 [Thunnus maccoyii]XP_042273663.1 zinc finger protein 644 [Thunnus maccoyii]XP_042273664.1 zinc finger protein 644 [Thunnus maccoyii]